MPAMPEAKRAWQQKKRAESAWVTKSCFACGDDHPRDQYLNHGQGVVCAACRVFGFDYMKFYFVRRKYGLLPWEYAERLAEAEGCCQMCGQPFAGEPHLDHDHLSGNPRGFLCVRCNTMLPAVEDPEFLGRALSYLERWSN